MGIANVIDKRKRPYRFKKINAIVEATWHDNSCKDADKISSRGSQGPDYEEMEHITLADAIEWADNFSTPVTLYLYDKDDGIYPKNRGTRKMSKDRIRSLAQQIKV